MNRPFIKVHMRETQRTSEGWFPAVALTWYPSGEVQAYVIHPEQQMVLIVPATEWREYWSAATDGTDGAVTATKRSSGSVRSADPGEELLTVSEASRRQK